MLGSVELLGLPRDQTMTITRGEQHIEVRRARAAGRDQLPVGRPGRRAQPRLPLRPPGSAPTHRITTRPTDPAPARSWRHCRRARCRRQHRAHPHREAPRGTRRPTHRGERPPRTTRRYPRRAPSPPPRPATARHPTLTATLRTRQQRLHLQEHSKLQDQRRITRRHRAAPGRTRRRRRPLPPRRRRATNAAASRSPRTCTPPGSTRSCPRPWPPPPSTGSCTTPTSAKPAARACACPKPSPATTLTEVPRTCSLKFPTHGAAGRRVAGWRKEVPSTLRLPGRRPSKGPVANAHMGGRVGSRSPVQAGLDDQRDRPPSRPGPQDDPGVRVRGTGPGGAPTLDPAGVRIVRRLRVPAVGR